MGTDIHTRIEAKRNGVWETVPPPEWLEIDDYCRERGSWCWDRNYDAFAILADVRNGFGFAGSSTGEALIPVVPERRGLPEDLVKSADDYEFGDHSFHWLTLRELVDYPHWDKQRLAFGVVSSEAYVATLKGKPTRVNDGPTEYCSWVTGPDVRVVEESEYLALGDSAPADKKMYVRVKWPETYAFSAGTWYTDFLPALRRWADENRVAYEDVRLVMGFDS